MLLLSCASVVSGLLEVDPALSSSKGRLENEAMQETGWHVRRGRCSPLHVGEDVQLLVTFKSYTDL